MAENIKVGPTCLLFLNVLAMFTRNTGMLCASMQWFDLITASKLEVEACGLDDKCSSCRHCIMMMNYRGNLIRIIGICALYLSVKQTCTQHDDVIKLKHFPRCWPFVRRIHRLPVDSPHKSHLYGVVVTTYTPKRDREDFFRCQMGLPKLKISI